jgi:cytochrome c oxidase cbb3-type subunit III
MGHGKEMKARLGVLLKASCIAFVLGLQSGTAVSQVADSKGKHLFESSCAVCHGLDGGGGEHAPNIGRGSAVKSKSDSDITRIVAEGILSKGMPPFANLGDLKVQSIVSYLRLLQAKAENRADTGNPVLGKQLFFGKGQCSDCHAIRGEGHFLSTDLSDFADDHDSSDIRAAIVSPQEQEATPRVLARVTGNSGQHFTGVILNENSSSLQIQDANGEFYLFMKSGLQSIDRSPASSMPADYQQKLSSAEIDDLVSYIVHQAPGSQATISQPSISQPTPHEKEN